MTTSTAAGTRRARTRVLVAEDDATNAMLAHMALEHFACDVSLVGDGAEAVDAATREAFDLVFMDYHMPVMDGLHATAAIRAFEAAHLRRRTPIVALTASAMPDERTRCLEAGMDDIMLKPFAFADLARMLERWAGHDPDDAAPQR